MWRYIRKRTTAMVVTLFFASIIIFAFIHVIPGDPIYVMLGDMATPEQAEKLRHSLGLDRPIVDQPGNRPALRNAFSVRHDP